MRTPLFSRLADAVLLGAWAVLVLDGVRQTRRASRSRPQQWSPSVLAGIAAASVALGGALVLERLTWRFAFHPGSALAGTLLLAAGVFLHGWARRTLGASWSPGLIVPEHGALVARGPYAYVRHPIYLAGLLLAAGTFLTHPSPASLCLAGGLTAGVLAKAWREDRALRAALGDEYARYAARVPALVPRPRAVWRMRSASGE